MMLAGSSVDRSGLGGIAGRSERGQLVGVGREQAQQVLHVGQGVLLGGRLDGAQPARPGVHGRATRAGGSRCAPR